MLEWLELLGLKSVPVIWQGKFDRERIWQDISIDTEREEGYVVRKASSFSYDDFGKSVAKWVRKGHVNTGEHWTRERIIVNGSRAGKALAMTEV